MRIALRYGTLLLCLIPPVSLQADDDSDANRTYLEKVHSREFVTFEDYEDSQLITLTATQSEKKADKAVEVIRQFVRENGKDLSGAGADLRPEAYAREKFHLPPFVTDDKQGSGIDACTKKYCLMKLNAASEISLIESEPKEKRKVYSDIIASRLREFLQRRQLKGYEDRPDNVVIIQKSLAQLGWLKKKYPDEFSFLTGGLWTNGKPPASLKGSYLQQERLYLEIKKMQPVWRIGYLMEFQTPGGTLFFDLHLYSNHYFDSSFTIYEVIPDGEKSILVQTDVMELDELKKSGFIRMLYKGKMQEAVELHQKDRLFLWK